MPATGTGTRGIHRRYGQEQAARPDHLVLQLPPELGPSLIENRPVEAGLLFHSAARPLNRTSSRPGHITHLQVFDDDHRVALADGRGSFVQVVPAGIANPNMDTLDFSLCLLPVVGKLLLAAHGPLRLAQI